MVMLVSIVLLSACCNNATAQESSVVSVDVSTLSPAVQKALKSELAVKNAELKRLAQNTIIKNEINTYAEWAGKGKEIGTAVSEGLHAVKDVTLELADSDVGQVTIWLIVWKVAGKDVVQIIVGLLLLIVSTIVIVSSYTRTFKRKVLIKGGWRQEKEWRVVDSREFWRYPNAAAAVHCLIWLVMIAVSSIVMFA